MLGTAMECGPAFAVPSCFLSQSVFRRDNVAIMFWDENSSEEKRLFVCLKTSQSD